MEKVILNLSTTEATFLDDTTNPRYEETDVVLLGIACDLTASYNKGAWYGPFAILDASYQVEYATPVFHLALTDVVKIHNKGILECPNSLDEEGNLLAFEYETIEEIMTEMVEKTKDIATAVFKDKKMLMVFGGDHSVPNGVWNSIEELYSSEEVFILHFDGHLDLRETLDEHKYSHACIMRRAREKGFQVVQVGMRDHLSEEEVEYIQENNFQKDLYFCATQTKEFYTEFETQITTNRVLEIPNLLFNGKITAEQLKTIVDKIVLAKYLWITVDVDGLDASDIPGTGTPLPLGLKRSTLRKIIYEVLRAATKNNVQFLGFDINEVAPQLKKEGEYTPLNTVSTLNEMDAALLAYNILFWNYLDRFSK